MKRGLIYALIGLLAMYVVCQRHAQTIDQTITSPVLGPDDKAKIVFDASRHTVTRTDVNGTIRSFLNTHGPVAVVEKKDGQTILIQRTWGTEFSPFVGGSFGNDYTFRIAAGVNGFYIQRWELGGGLLLNPSEIRDVRAFGQVAYNVYGNWLISAAVDHHKAVHLIASVRF